jgi:type VI secretion system protein ImpK
MNTSIDRRTSSELTGNQRRDDRPREGHVKSLLDLLQDGLYLVFMLQNGAKPPHQLALEERETASRDAKASAPSADAATDAKRTPTNPKDAGTLDAELLKRKIDDFLAEFDREARKIRAHGDDILAAKYAFCAAVDEMVLGAQLMMSEYWREHPLQLSVFGDQLAGGHFFDRLEALRSKGGARLQALQVFHMILLLGFKGTYLHEPSDKLDYLTARLGEEIAHVKGKSHGFAPQAERPDQIINKLRSEVPLWAFSAVFAAIALGVFVGMKSSLDHSTQNSMAAYTDLIKLAPRPANVTITLP